MVKGYFVGPKPDLSKYTLLKVLSEMDVLSEEDDEVKSTPDNPMQVKNYLGEKIKIVTISEYPEKSLQSLISVCLILRSAAPEFFQFFEHNNTLLLIYPIHPNFDPDDEHSENVWDRIIEELLRITLIGMTSDGITNATEFVKSYINIFIKWN